MAIYGCRVKIVGRSGGRSSVAAAAYRARDMLKDARTGQQHDYRKAYGGNDLAFEGIYAPKDAPAWATDREQLWNKVEATENRSNSQLAREFQVDLPHELTEEQNRYLVQDFVRQNFTRKGYVADVAIHRPHEHGDARNIHAHILVPTRPLDSDGFASHKDREQNSKAQFATWRESWAQHLAHHLDRHGFTLQAERMEHGHLTLREQETAALRREDFDYAEQLDREPTIHLGKDAAAMERRGLETDKGDVNRAVNHAAVLERAAAKAERLGARVLEDVTGTVERAATWLERFLFGGGEAAPTQPAPAPERKSEGQAVREHIGRMEPQVQAADPNVPRYRFGVDPELVAELRRKREERERDDDERGRDRDDR